MPILVDEAVICHASDVCIVTQTQAKASEHARENLGDCGQQTGRGGWYSLAC